MRVAERELRARLGPWSGLVTRTRGIPWIQARDEPRTCELRKLQCYRALHCFLRPRPEDLRDTARVLHSRQLAKVEPAIEDPSPQSSKEATSEAIAPICLCRKGAASRRSSQS